MQRLLSSRRLAFVLALALAGSAGCSSEGDETGATGSTSPSAASSGSLPTSGSASVDSDPTTWVLRPGGLGPLEIGMTADDLQSAGLVRQVTAEACDIVWVESPQLEAAGIGLEFRDGNPDDLDQISVFVGEGRALSTEAGFTLGSSVESLKAIYGDALQIGEPLPEGGAEATSYVVTEAGALTFAADGGPVDVAVATGLSPTGEYVPPTGGC